MTDKVCLALASISSPAAASLIVHVVCHYRSVLTYNMSSEAGCCTAAHEYWCQAYFATDVVINEPESANTVISFVISNITNVVYHAGVESNPVQQCVLQPFQEGQASLSMGQKAQTPL